MSGILENKTLKKILNIPIVWNIAQDIIGANQWKNVLYPSVFEKRGGALLDFGCSSGNETAAFLDFDYYGIDVDEQAIRGAKDKFQQYPHIQFHTLDIIKEGFKKDFFDHVLFAGTGHHLTDDDFKKILDVLIANLKPGGQLHFFDIVRQPGKDRWSTRLMTRSDQGKHVRTEEIYKSFFEPKKAQITEWKVYSSPDRFIKLQDVLYVRIIKGTAL